MSSGLEQYQVGDVGPGATIAQGRNITINQAINKIDLTKALPKRIYTGLPDPLEGYHAHEADLQVLKTFLINSYRNTGIVGQSRAAVLRGMGGVGKTVLATALVHDPDVRRVFYYGIVWLTCGRSANTLDQLAVLTRAVTGQSAGYASV